MTFRAVASVLACASCDIFADDGVLYKHIPENAISRAGSDKKQILRPPAP